MLKNMLFKLWNFTKSLIRILLFIVIWVVVCVAVLVAIFGIPDNLLD